MNGTHCKNSCMRFRASTPISFILTPFVPITIPIENGIDHTTNIFELNCAKEDLEKESGDMSIPSRRRTFLRIAFNQNVSTDLCHSLFSFPWFTILYYLHLTTIRYLFT